LNFKSFVKSPEKWILVLIALAVGATGFGIFMALRPASSDSSQNPTPTPTPSAASNSNLITALGRLEPGGEVFCVSPPSANSSGRVMKLMAKEGDLVKQGQPIAVMDTYERLVAAGMQAEAQVREAQARVAQASTGAKQEDVGAQAAQANAKLAEIGSKEAAISRAKAALETAQVRFKRYEENKDGLSKNDYDQQRLELASAEAAFVQAQKEREQAIREFQQQQQTGSGLANVRPVDVQQAQASLQVAVANLQQAKANFETATVRSPIAGRILKVHAKETEQVSSLVTSGGSQSCSGIAEVGRTDQMYAVAEVYESDVAKIRAGQKATITSPAFPGELAGTVAQVGLKVGKKDVLNTDPAADTDARVVEVKVRLTDSKPVEGLTNLQVQVAIAP
jgi:HlyD family secretion protein